MPGRISEQTIEEVRNRNDIVAVIDGYVPLKKRGSDFWACCPFHKEKTPSFKVSPGHQTYYCFGCKKSGNVFHFVMERENVDFIGAVKLLAQRAGVFIAEEAPLPQAGGARQARDSRISRERIYEVLGQATKWYQRQLQEPRAEPARRYLAERGLDAESVSKFGLGYSPDSWDAMIKWGERQGFELRLLLAAGLVTKREAEDGSDGSDRTYDRFRGRLMFPIWDELGRVVGFSARILEKDAATAKYINTPETGVFHKGKILYGLNFARKPFKDFGYALVCEGQLDVIACHRAGLENAVAPQGTAFTELQARILKRYADEVTFAFDADEAGLKAALRSLEVALVADLRARVVMLPEGKDPDGIFREDGPPALQALVENSVEAFDFVLTQSRREHDQNTAHGKEAIVRQVLTVISKVGKPVTRASLCQRLGEELRLPETAVFQAMNNLLRAQQRQGRRYGGDGGSEAPATSVPASARAMTGNGVVPALLGLLDLALHNGPIAHRLAENELLTPANLGPSPVEQALLLVLQKTAEDEWHNAASAIGAHQELAAVPEISEILHRSRYPAATPDLDQREQQRITALLGKAANDCLASIESQSIDEQLHALKKQWEEENDAEKCREIMRRLQRLTVQKKRLRS